MRQRPAACDGRPKRPWRWATDVAWRERIRPGDLSRLDAAFFTMNGVMSLTVFAFALVDRLG